jgi:hypothetical protein
MGTWSLRIVDTAAGDWGNLNDWSIIFNNIATYPSRDYYRISLQNGDRINLVAKTLVGTFVNVSLYTPTFTLAATVATGKTNVEKFISDYAVTVTGNYYIYVTSDNWYNIVVTKNCVFDLEPNNDIATRQLVSPNYRNVMGYVSGSGTDYDSYGYSLTYGQTVDVWIHVPSYETDGEFTNDLRATLQIFDPSSVSVYFQTSPGTGMMRFTYTPTATGVHTFEISAGGLGGEYTLFFNRYPIAVYDEYTCMEDSVANPIFPLVNDVDFDGDTFSIYDFTQTYNGYVEWISGTEFRYTPNTNFYGYDGFLYWVSDAWGGTSYATVYIYVNPVQDPPVAVNDEYTVRQDSAGNRFNVLDNDYDVDNDALTVESVSLAFYGMVEITAGGTAIEYTPNPGFYGTDVFTYTVSDGNGNTDTAIVNVNVLPLPVVGQAFETPPISEKSTKSSATVNVVVADGVLIAVLFVLLVALFRRREKKD